ncbi:MAG: mechanosensitive ion channel family protein [Bacteroidetes bacterium]|nr:mechanosensitive ion channel family protein [Bacteroidota bacterium]
MNIRSFIPVPAILVLFVTLTGALSAQEVVEVDRDSPRATFRSYLENIVQYTSAEQEEVAERALQHAVACLDLSGLPSALREERGRRAARDLKIFFDRYELIDLDEIPEEWDGTRYIWRKPTADAEISLTLGEDSLWRFSERTIESLPILLDLVRGEDIVEGVETTLAPETLADWMRSNLPKSLRVRTVYFENWQWLALLVIIFIGVLIERLIIFFASDWIQRLIRRGKASLEFEVDRQLIKPLGILAMALWWSLMLTPLDLPLQATAILFFAVQFVIAGSGVWAAYRMVDLLAAYFMTLAVRTDSKFDDLLVPMLRRVLKIIVIAFGLLFIADNLDIDITSLLAGIGIGGIAFALAAKDTVENLFGSLTVMFDKPFEIGDWIKIGDLEGTVEDVGFRSTRIRTFYNSQISMPNSRLVSIPVDNLGRRRYRRVSTTLGVQYDTPPDTIDAFCEGIRELIRKHPYTRKDMYMVYFNEFADFSLNILLYVFHETPDWPTELRERHRLFTDILRLARKLGVEFAFPTQTLHIANAPPIELRSSDAAPASGMSEHRQGTVPPPEDVDELSASRLRGRMEADAIVQALWGDMQQAPVSFDEAGSMNPGEGTSKHHKHDHT